ncbi:FG-GAP-like repeat-containing protein [Flagellimonas crocea]|uniref:FG-GAP-like repeat-containing protein n=1 Tax=Flagellimonas crocea TaxID=3067311 RepID=UPI00296EB3E7|nr:FG-GAP-like repeat-containing protein [Muricauda sp. DH64]
MKKLLLSVLMILGIHDLFGQVDYNEYPLQSSSLPLVEREEDTSEIMPPFLMFEPSAQMSSMAGGAENISETLGEASVSLTGGASYTIPIKVPPGINGVVPNIALAYNSQAGNGLAGYGWNISGISVITRIPNTKYHDNYVDPVDFDGNDRFAFDGQRLLLKSGTYGGDGAVYETENFSNLKITSHLVSTYGSTYGPKYFTITYPDGSIATYGNSTDSYSRTDYAITKWKNPQGVVVDYTYILTDNSLNISKIKFGHKDGGSALNEIEFVYKTRTRAEQSFIGGQDFRRKTILSEIRVKTGAVGYRNYVLAHSSNDLGYDRLTSVTEKNGDNTLSHSPISFTYTSSSPTLNYGSVTTSLSVSNIETRTADVVPMDYNADGNMDFILVPKDQAQRNKVWIFDNVKQGSAEPGKLVSGLTSYVHVAAINHLNAVNHMSKTQGFLTVTNGSGAQVVFRVNGPTGTSYAAQLYSKSWNAPSYQSRSSCSVTATTYKAPLVYVSGDFNGDGLTDVIAINRPYSYNNCTLRASTPENPCGGGGNPQMQVQGIGLVGEETEAAAAAAAGDCCECNNTIVSSSKAYFINLDRRLTTGFSGTSGTLSVAYNYGDQLLTADVDGDGKTDLLHVTNGKIYAYGFSATSFTLQPIGTTTDTRIKKDYPVLLGDYNGDGKVDFMTPTATNSALFALFLSNGPTFTKREVSYPFTYKLSQTATSPVTTYNLIASDINGDGRTDILEYYSNTSNGSTNGTQTLTMYRNIKSTTTDVTPQFSSGVAKTKTGNLVHFPIPVFLSSSDKQNTNLDFATISNNWVTYFTFGQDNRQDMLLRTVGQNGVNYDFTYRKLDAASSNVGNDGIKIYEEKDDQLFPYVDIGSGTGLLVVSSLKRSSTYAGTTIWQDFSYQGAVSNTEGLGFMGFLGLARSHWTTGNTDRIWDISRQDMNLRGAVTTSYTTPYTINYSTVPSDYMTAVTNSYGSSLLSNKVFKIWMNTSIAQNRLENTSVSTSYLYETNNPYNLPIKTTVDYNGSGTRVTDVTYAHSTGATYYIGRPTIKKETGTINGNTFTTEEQYTYTGYLLTTLKKKGNGTQFDTEVYTYDAFGNITKKVTTPYNTGARQVDFTFDSSGRYLLTSKDVESLITTFEYNTATGTLKKETNPHGLITQYFYDGWNRLTKVTDYLGKNANTTYVESLYSYTVTVSADDGSSTITVYDPLKRTTKTSKKDVLGQLISQSFQYDKFDRLWKKSEPFIGSSASQWNTIDYDLYGRVKTITEYTGRVSNYTYSNLSVTVNNGTKSVTTTKDPMGNVTRVVDPGGTMDYTYYGNGGLKTTVYGGITLSMEQDGWGRRTKLTDPSAGVYTYLYNGFGELIKETTPKGVTDYVYSTLGKLTQKKVTGDATNMTMDYAYDGTTKLPTSVTLTNTDGNSGTTTFAYDSYKRLATSVETNTYAKFSTWLTYDTYGRIATEEREARLLSNNKFSKIKTKNTYANGQLKNINDFTSNEELYNITGLNARGQATTATMGVGLKRTNTYDTNGYLTQALAQKNVTTTPVDVMKLTYNFNAQRGILNSRTNSLFTWSESFTYDSMDRLLTFNDNNGNRNQTYDSKGRIDVNSVLGQYKYSTTNFQQTELAFNAMGEAYYNNYGAQNVSYNAFKSPVEIKETGKEYFSFQYNAGMGRANMFYGDTQTDKLQRRYRRHYSEDGSMDITWDKNTGKTTFVTYVNGNGYTSPVIFRSEQISTTVAEYQYLHRDYLGSILAVTDKNGNLREKRHFNAWGEIVKWTNGSGTTIAGGMAGGAMLDRGFTGHEHLFGANLVHMNGRLYDPILHRFLMPDNFVQDPYNSLSFNRYAYTWNNPLMYTDINGEWLGIDDIIAGVIGGVVNLVVNIVQGNIQGNFWQVLGQGAAAFGAGFAAGTLALYGPAGWAAGGAIVGGTNAWLSGGNVWEGIGIGAVSGLVGGQFGKWAGQLGGVVINGIRTSSPLIKSLVGGVIGGALGGGTTSFAIALGSGASFEEALDAGWQATKQGAVIGAMTGLGAGYAQSRVDKVNFLTGKSLVTPTAQPTSEASTSTLTKYYPENDGAVPGTFEDTYLYENTILDRFGSLGPKSDYLAPFGTPKEFLALPPNNDGIFSRYQVIKPFPVRASLVAPFGLSNQYQTPVPINVLLRRGIIIKIN